MFECGLIHIALLVLRVLDMKCEGPYAKYTRRRACSPEAVSRFSGSGRW
jgi:hypothetical protein